MVNIKIDLKKSFIEVTKRYIHDLENSLPSLNYGNITNEVDFQNVCLAYFDIYTRLIPTVPRRVIKSDQFYCPVRCKEGLKKLEDMINSGQDITSYLSRGVKNIRTIITKKGKAEVINLNSLLNA